MILTFLLFLFTALLCSIFYFVGLVYMLIRSIKHKGLKKYFYQLAFSLDQTGNVVCGPMFNDFFIYPDGHRMGNPDETISHVLGKNLQTDTLSPFGVKIANTVDWVAFLLAGELDHCLNAANNSQINLDN